MRLVGLVAVLAIATLAAGCATQGAGIAPFHSVDLQENLSKGDLARYETEAKGVNVDGQSSGMPYLEKTHWWLPSLVAYWNKGSVRIMTGANGERTYMVSKTLGYGPLAMLWVSKEDAVYAGDGSLSSVMAMKSVLWGHLAMIHDMRWKLPDGTWHNHNASHLIHHSLNIAGGHAEKSVSLFSAPNPAGFDY